MANKLTLENCQKMNYYELLKIEANSSIEEVKRAYKKRALEVHPDKNPDDENACTKIFLFSF